MTAAATAVERHVVITDDAAPLILARFTRRQARYACLLVCDPDADRMMWMLGEPSAVGHLLDQGCEVFVAELRGCGLSAAAGAAQARSVGDHAMLDVPALVRAASRLCGNLPLHWIGHRRGAAVALTADGVESVVGFDAAPLPGIDTGYGPRRVLLLHGRNDAGARRDAERLVVMLGTGRCIRREIAAATGNLAGAAAGAALAAPLWGSVIGWFAGTDVPVLAGGTLAV